MAEQSPLVDRPVTLVVARQVKPGCNQQFEEWLNGIKQEMRSFAGFRGLQMVPPVADVQPEHVVLFQFDNPIHLMQWYDSEERRVWLEKSRSFTERQVVTQLVSGLDGLFQAPSPAKYKSVVVVTLGLYPLVVLTNLWLVPHLEFIALLPRLLVTTIVNVTLMAYVMMPLVTRLLGSWLTKPVSA